jgi:glucokinase-like ROK family protein
MERQPDGTGTADAGIIRSVNRTLVLDAIKRDGPVSRAGLAKVVSLAKPTVSLIVDDLLAAGLVREVGTERVGTGRGRPGMLLAFNARSLFVVGVHVGVHYTSLVLADAAGRELARRRSPTSHAPAAEALTGIADSIEALIDGAGISRKRLSSVGVSVPGVVDLETGVCVHAPNLGWRDVPVAEAISARIGAGTYVHNATQAAAAAELVEGAGRGARSMVLLYAGTGVGSAIVNDGRLLHGAGGMAGEIGHALFPGSTEACRCGKIGCLESEASAPALARKARRAMAEGRTTRLTSLGESVTGLDVYAAADAGDPVAIELMADTGRLLGIAASWLVNLINPSVLVVGGGLFTAGELLLGPFREAVMGNAMAPVAARLTIRPWALGQDAKARGAVILALQRADRSYRVVFGSA